MKKSLNFSTIWKTKIEYFSLSAFLIDIFSGIRKTIVPYKDPVSRKIGAQKSIVPYKAPVIVPFKGPTLVSYSDSPL